MKPADALCYVSHVLHPEYMRVYVGGRRAAARQDEKDSVLYSFGITSEVR